MITEDSSVSHDITHPAAHDSSAVFALNVQSIIVNNALVGEKTDRPIRASCEHPWLGWVKGAVVYTLKLVHFMPPQNFNRHNQGICHQILWTQEAVTTKASQNVV